MTADTRSHLRGLLTCDGCGAHVGTVVKVTDHVAFCSACLARYGAVKL